jgi:hypothetical protein
MGVTRFLLFIIASFSFSFAAHAKSNPNGDLYCIASIVKAEANGESKTGKAYVAGAIKERIKRGYAKSACGLSGFAHRKAPYSDDVMAASRAARANGVTHFHSYRNKRTSNASWSVKKDKHGNYTWAFVAKIGGHWFFNAPPYAKARAPYEYDGEEELNEMWKTSVETPEEEAMAEAGEQYFPADPEPRDDDFDDGDVMEI